MIHSDHAMKLRLSPRQRSRRGKFPLRKHVDMTSKCQSIHHKFRKYAPYQEAEAVKPSDLWKKEQRRINTK